MDGTLRGVGVAVCPGAFGQLFFKCMLLRDMLRVNEKIDKSGVVRCMYTSMRFNGFLLAFTASLSTYR